MGEHGGFDRLGVTVFERQPLLGDQLSVDANPDAVLSRFDVEGGPFPIALRAVLR